MSLNDARLRRGYWFLVVVCENDNRRRRRRSQANEVMKRKDEGGVWKRVSPKVFVVGSLKIRNWKQEVGRRTDSSWRWRGLVM